MKINDSVGDRLRRFRVHKNMTQEELGDYLGITKAAVQKYESGAIKNFKSDTIRKLCQLFNVPPAYFIFDRVPDLSTDEMKDILISHFGSWLISFLERLDNLNYMGKEKLIEYCNDLSMIEIYCKERKEEPQKF